MLIQQPSVKNILCVTFYQQMKSVIVKAHELQCFILQLYCSAVYVMTFHVLYLILTENPVFLHAARQTLLESTPGTELPRVGVEFTVTIKAACKRLKYKAIMYYLLLICIKAACKRLKYKAIMYYLLFLIIYC